MDQPKSAGLYDRQASRAYYEDRFASGYMDAWPAETKRRIADLVRGLALPDRGEALDFGCGNGVLTDVLRQALPPGWTVYGTDISETAIGNARRRYPRCTFFPADDAGYAGKKFDFLFTHHVFEHVYDLDRTVAEVIARMKAASAMLHVVPCGNGGSFEHGVCLLRRDGIDAELHNRFFFEDEGHLRRLTTDEFVAPWAGTGFALEREYYSNQRFGAVDWISRREPAFIRMFTETSKAVDAKAKVRLVRMRLALLALWALRRPVAVVEHRLRKRGRTARDWILLMCGLPLYVIAKPVDASVKASARKEWRTRRTERNGSEMYLVFRR
ncbi:MAG: methyltransferase domain-containing protein [Candidatus Krumholzibacteriaceae bacterium]|jgi:SAM-dependent methyltransferase